MYQEPAAAVSRGGLFSPLLKKMMMPYNFKAMAAVLEKMIDEGKLGEASGEGFFKYE